eukprot:scaffold5810_cov109-Cylindrotheca_fusiformis.AAC.3
MGLTITSYAEATQNDFPLVTIPHFDYRGTQLMKLLNTGAHSLSWNVLVPPDMTETWNSYTVQDTEWIPWVKDHMNSTEDSISPYIFKYIEDEHDHEHEDEHRVRQKDTSDALKLVHWQMVPTDPERINENVIDTTLGRVAYHATMLVGNESVTSSPRIALSKVMMIHEGDDHGHHHEENEPESQILLPVYKELEDRQTVVGFLVVELPWTAYFKNILAEGVPPLQLVLTNTCGQTLTFDIDGPNVIVASDEEDLHDTEFDSTAVHAEFYSSSRVPMDADSEDWCDFDYTIYATKEFQELFYTDEPIVYTVGVVLIFLFTSAVFVLYDMFVSKRQSKVEETAARSNALVQSLFPAQVRDRLLQQNMEQEEKERQHKESGAPKRKDIPLDDSSRFLQTNNDVNIDDEDAMTDRLLQTKPIADLFPNATVLFADICGFTAWSSVREPTQVFTLLEQIYNTFDILARKRRIFKVETIGDCYVAAAGLPDPRPDHATAMARFANECLLKMQSVVKKLEVRLGPDTAELGMRIGVHSGPVTAGVLRGEKSRFQLFGDTVNTASRIETTGERNRVHLSEDTAKLLINAGKESWVKKRDGLVSAKGKGEMVTYWLTLTNRRGKKKRAKSVIINPDESSVSPTPAAPSSERSLASTISRRRTTLGPVSTITDRKQRLIDWNVDVLSTFLKKIQAMREEESLNGKTKLPLEDLSNMDDHHQNTTVLDEVQEIITLPQEEQVYKRDPASLELDPKVLAELKAFVGLIASMYQDNSFHNFEHASHVTQSVTKLLSRIVTADDIDYTEFQYKKKDNVSRLHKHTYGITSDPITQFACAFSALIHDVDHTGLPNAQLVKEETEIALFYRNKSVAEQNSVDLAWELLMESEFEGLRSFIYRNNEELNRFRQLVVNSVMATDIADRELGAARKARWVKAFQVTDGPESSSLSQENPVDAINRKATIVIEHLIQASDVAHTMQHWHVYVKWNEKLFHEMYNAFQAGRADVDPSENWYKSELGFFDFYIIPLAKKLKECGVFGVASDEYLNYAEANRSEWERKGENMVKAYLYSYQQKGKIPAKIQL